MLADASRHCASVARELLHPGALEFWLPVLPALVYWLVAGLYEVLDRLQLPATERYRLHSQAESDTRNIPSRGHVVRRVLLQHAIQIATAFVFTLADPGLCERTRTPTSLSGAAYWVKALGRWLAGMLVMDGWQYAIHRAMHEHKGLYNAFHSTHHRLLVPYAYGALYNHPVEAFLLDTVGSLVSVLASGMSCEMSVCFYTFSTIKTVLDHSGYRWPVNPLHDLFPNNAAVHDVHHDLRGFRKNYSQPYFVHWDWLLGTYADPVEFAKAGGKARLAAAAAAPAAAAQEGGKEATNGRAGRKAAQSKKDS